VSDNGLKGSINYQVISPKDLAKSVLSEAGRSNYICKGKKSQDPLNMALLSVGGEWNYLSRNHGAVWDTSRIPQVALQSRFLVTSGYDAEMDLGREGSTN
ncbi:hypothetical protein RYX36_032118, partial [Vicia faba]